MSEHGEDSDLKRAIAASTLSRWDSPWRDRLIAEALPVELPAGSVIYRENEPARCFLIVRGLLRTFLTSPDGRKVTVCYARVGELFGVASVAGGPMPVNVDAVTKSSLLMLNTGLLQRLAESEPRFGWLLAQETALRFTETLEAVAVNAFGSLLERLSRALLDLSELRPDGTLVVNVTQQELAETVGSVRSAVARRIGELRDDGLVRPSAGAIAIVDPEGLHRKTWTASV